MTDEIDAIDDTASDDATLPMKGKELEELVLFRARSYDEPEHNYIMGRCGVMSFYNKGVWVPIQSLPDMEGTLASGRHFIFDCKVCSQSSYDMTGGTHKSFAHQLKYLRSRARFNAICFILMHFNARVLKTKSEDAFTVAFPVRDNAFWEGYDRGEQKKISRTEAKLYGVPVEWNAPGRKKKASPDILAAINKMMKQEESTYVE